MQLGVSPCPGVGKAAFGLGAGAAQGEGEGGRWQAGWAPLAGGSILLSGIWPWGPVADCSSLLLGNQNQSIVSNFNKLIQFDEQKRQKGGNMYCFQPEASG